MAKKKTSDFLDDIPPSPDVGDVVIFDYNGRTFPAIVDSIDDDGRPNLTGFENGKVVAMPHCKDGAWHAR